MTLKRVGLRSLNKRCKIMSILGLLGLLFIGLKLTGYIDWSWVYVTMPFWGGLAVWLVIVVLGFLGCFTAAVFGGGRGKRPNRRNW
jgi:hypothetical protein